MPGDAIHESIQDQKQQPHRHPLQQHPADHASRGLADDPIFSSRPEYRRADGSALDFMQRLGCEGQRRQGRQGQHPEIPFHAQRQQIAHGIPKAIIVHLGIFQITDQPIGSPSYGQIDCDYSGNQGRKKPAPRDCAAKIRQYALHKSLLVSVIPINDRAVDGIHCQQAFKIICKEIPNRHKLVCVRCVFTAHTHIP